MNEITIYAILAYLLIGCFVGVSRQGNTGVLFRKNKQGKTVPSRSAHFIFVVFWPLVLLTKRF
jgi:branched-subunit amino acid permease